MENKLGIILLDENEVIVRIYQKNAQGRWTLLRHHDRDLATFDITTHPKVTDIVEVIVQVSLSSYGSKVDDWRIISRGIDEEVSQEVSMATGIPAEFLTLRREQELLCKGLLIEME